MRWWKANWFANDWWANHWFAGLGVNGGASSQVGGRHIYHQIMALAVQYQQEAVRRVQLVDMLANRALLLRQQRLMEEGWRQQQQRAVAASVSVLLAEL